MLHDAKLPFVLALSVGCSSRICETAHALPDTIAADSYELRDLVSIPEDLDCYFKNLDASFGEKPGKIDYFIELEGRLQDLDDDAWAFLKAEVRPLITKPQRDRRWQPLIDILNQTKAYRHLKRIGCQHVTFIPTAKKKGQKTPDLRAVRRAQIVLCEVKTINIPEMK